LAEALDPERRRASGIEYRKAPNISEQVELTVAEGDEVVLEFLPLIRR
jgi:hypothetical protein